jgi:hypothetical protein
MDYPPVIPAAPSDPVPPLPKPKILPLLYIIPVSILIVLFAVVYYLFNKSLPGLGPKISVNFLLKPGAQNEPLVYANGRWLTLPRSQNNLYDSGKQLLTVCGTGGAYIYDPSVNKITYFFRQDWYPCDAITQLNPDQVLLTDDKGIATVNLTDKKLIKRDESNVPSYNYASHSNQKNNFLSACDGDTCARLTPGGEISLSKNSKAYSNFTISNAIALVGLKGNYLFYAVNASYGYRQNIFSLVTPARAYVVNHQLYVYLIDQGKSYKMLNSFRYDDQEMIFIDRVANSFLITENHGNPDQWDNITPGLKNSTLYPELDYYQRKKFPVSASTDRKVLDPVTTSDHILGNPAADISLVLQCSLESERCKDFVLNHLEAFLNHYQNRINVVYRHHVSEGVPRDQSQEAAEFSECVSKNSGESKFWDFIRLYFSQTNSIGNGVGIKYMPNIVSRIGGDTDKTVKCFLNGETTNLVLGQDEKAVLYGCESVLVWKSGFLPNVCGYDLTDLASLTTSLDKQISDHDIKLQLK